MYGQNLVEDNLILTIEARDFRYQGIEFGNIVRGGSINERCQPLVTVILPGILISAYQRRFIGQTGRRHKGSKGAIGFGQCLFTAASFADSSADAPASTIFTYSITRTRSVRLWLMGSIIDSTTWISLFTLSKELLLLMMRPTLVRVLAIKKKSSEKKTIRDDFLTT